jgi:adenosylhomocysteine nucleosidase
LVQTGEGRALAWEEHTLHLQFLRPTEDVASPAKQEALRKEFKADATEMEGAAVAQICCQRGVPRLVLRSMSDSAGTKAPEDFRLFARSAAKNAALLVTGIVGRLEAK